MHGIDIPKEDKLTRFDLKPFGQALVSLLISTFHLLSRISGLIFLNPQVPGIIPYSVIIAALMMANIPLAASEWPIFALMALRMSGFSGLLVSFIALDTA